MNADRRQNIVRMLVDSPTWITASGIALEIGCSSRTVKSDINLINRQHVNLVEASSKGYRISDGGRAAKLPARLDAAAPQTSEERKRFILFELLMRHRLVSLSDLADALCISPATLDNELVSIKQELVRYGLAMRSKTGNLMVEGSEIGEKKLVNQLIFDETKDFFNQIELINRYFPDQDLKSLQEKIDASLKQHGYFMNGYAQSNLILHIAIFVERIQNGFGAMPYAEEVADAGREEDRGIANVVAEICASIEPTLGMPVPVADRRALHLMLSSNLVGTAQPASLEETEDAACGLFRRIAERVHDQFGLALTDKEFELRFSLHLGNLLTRAKQGLLLRNPQLQAIKNGYPFIYDVAVSVADVMLNEAGMQVNEDEIGYIALHIGCLVEEQRANDGKLRALLVCVRHSAYDAVRIDGFSHELDSAVVVDGVVSSMDEVGPTPREDLIITTLLVSGFCPAAVVSISPFFSKQDVAAVLKRVQAIRTRRARAALKQGIQTFFNEEFFSADPDVAGWQELIEHMGASLINHGYAFDDFVDRLLERERMSSSAYREIAMPHPIDMNARRTAVSVSLFPHGISWNGTVVYAVIMLAIKRGERAFFSELFNSISGVLVNPGAARQLARAKSYQQFTETLVSLV